MKIAELQPGMVVAANGTKMLILEVDTIGVKPFFQGASSIRFLSNEAAEHGSLSRTVSPSEEFTVLSGRERQETLKEIQSGLIESKDRLVELMGAVTIAMLTAVE